MFGFRSLPWLGIVMATILLSGVPDLARADRAIGEDQVQGQALAFGCGKVSEAVFAMPDRRGQPQGLTTVTCTSSCSGTGNCEIWGCDASASGCSSFSCPGLNCGAGECTKTSTYTPSENIIGTGFGFDASDSAGPATIAYLYEDSNREALRVGDVILEYRGVSVASGVDLYQTILALPDVEPGDVVPMLLARESVGAPIQASPVARSIEVKDVETIFEDRICKETAGSCSCVAGSSGSTCTQTMHVELAPDGETMRVATACRSGERGSIRSNPVYSGK